VKRQWSSDDLMTHFTILPHEHQIIAPLRTDYTRLGFAVLLKCFLLDGRFPQFRMDVPTTVLAFLATQLDIDPVVYVQYEWRGRSSEDHRAQIRTLLGFREATIHDSDDLAVWLSTQILHTHDTDLARLKATAYTRYRALPCEPPTPDRVERMLRSALAAYEDRWYAQIFAHLTPTTIMALDALVTTTMPAESTADPTAPTAAPRTVLQILKTDPGPLRVETAYDEVAKLRHLRTLDLPANLFTTVPPRILATLRQRVAVEEPHELRRHPAPQRATLLAAFSFVRMQEVTDTLTDLLMKMIAHVGIRAERHVDKTVRQEVTHVANKNGVLGDLTEAVVENPDGIIRDVIFPIVDEATLRALLVDLRTTSRSYRRRVQIVMRRSYGHHYRRMVPPILQMLTFESNNALYRPLITALDLVRRYDGHDVRHYDGDDDVPLDGVVPQGWRDLVVEHDRHGHRHIHRISYEICVLHALREQVRCKEVWVNGANRYRNPDHDLPQDFADQRTTYYEALTLPTDGEAFIAALQTTHADALQQLNDGMPTNPHVQITAKAGGWIALSPLVAQPEPTHLLALKRAMGERWSMTSLLDMLKEADVRIQFTDQFKSLTEREHLDRATLQQRLLLCLYGLGTNTGLKRMRVGNPEVSYTDLLYVRRRFITCDSLRNAIAQVTNATFAARQVAIWGEITTTCASDAKKFGAWDQNLITEWHTRYHGRGVVIYWHVEKKSACIYSQLKRCSASEVAAAITGVIHHCTTMSVDRHYVDSHGQSEVAFGFSFLLGYDLCPRLKPIHTQKLYLPSTAHAERYPHLSLIVKRAIDWDLIRRQYDEMVKYATALRLGTAETEAILSRFTRNTPHPTYQALAELGRVVKTIFLCRYVDSESLRREIQEGLNVIENWNSANGFIFYGRHGEISTNRWDDQEVAMLTLHLLQNVLVFINTLMIQDILSDPAWRTRMTPTDLRGLTPLIYHHVNPYGLFTLDMSTRLDIADVAAAA